MKSWKQGIVIASVVIILSSYTSGSPVPTDVKCMNYLWTVSGNHYVPPPDNECLEGGDRFQIFKDPRVRRDLTSMLKFAEDKEFSKLLGNVMSLLNLDWNLGVKTEPGEACSACQTAVEMIRFFFEDGKTNEEMLSTASGICIALKIMSPEICEGLVALNGPPLMTTLRLTQLTPPEICTFFVPQDCDKINVTGHVWDIPVSEKPATRTMRKRPEDSPTLKVLHISDTHIDLEYKVGTWAECQLPLCCRKGLLLPTKKATKAGKWGGWKCDIPEQTLDNMLEHITTKHPDIDYVIWTGDIAAHDPWKQDKNVSKSLLNITVDKISKAFHSIPVFAAVGNHESSPVNLFPTTPLGKEWDIDWLYNQLDLEWSRWLPENTSSTVRQGAFYTLLIRPGLRLVSLNTNYCYFHNWWLILNSTDPVNELAWLTKVLSSAEARNEKVHIIGHIPPGSRDCLRVWQTNYYSIINRYEETVTAQFFGHLHTDEIELFYDKERPVNVAYIAPSVTTYTYLNPGYRIYTIDGDHEYSTRQVLDHETWILDLEEANKQDKPEWTKLYSAKEAYNMSSLTPQDWHEFYERLATDDDLLQLYYRHYNKNSPKIPPCDETCKAARLCDIRSCTQYPPNSTSRAD